MYPDLHYSKVYGIYYYEERETGVFRREMKTANIIF